MDKEKLEFLQNKAKDIRKITIEMIGRLGSGHVGGSLSIIDLLTDIYYNAGNMDAKNPSDPDRDRVVISKGHAGPGLYAVLASKGYFPMDEIKTLVSLLRRTSANVNQIARRVNSTSRVYENDLAEIQNRLGEVWLALDEVLRKLAAVE